MTKRVALRVSFDLPEGMSKTEARDYVADAVETWGGQCFPGNDEEPPDPRWLIGRDEHKVSVSFVR